MAQTLLTKVPIQPKLAPNALYRILTYPIVALVDFHWDLHSDDGMVCNQSFSYKFDHSLGDQL